MLPTPRLAAMFFVVFVLGAVAGALLYMNFATLRFADFLNRTSDPAKLALRINTKLTSQYKLSPDEQERISPFAKELADNLYNLRRRFAADVLTTIDASHTKIAAQMDPPHRDAYVKDNLDRHKRAVSMLMPDSTSGTGTTGADGSKP